MFSDLFLMSYPRPDWALRGKSNYFSAGAAQYPHGPRQAMADWLSIARHIEQAGGRVVVMPPAANVNLTGLPYTAEAGAFFRDADGAPGFLLSNMTPEHRRPEPTYIAGFMAALGWRTRAVPVRWEGQGDALRIDERRVVHTFGAGPAARTSAEAYSEVAALLSPSHLQVRYRAEPWFHGNTFLGSFRSKTGEHVVVLHPGALEPEQLDQLLAFLHGVPVVRIDAESSRNYATNALQVHDTVIAPSGLGETIYAVWRDLGLEVVMLDLPALFRSGGGAAVCLTNRLDGCRPEEIPAHLYFLAQRARLEQIAESYPLQAPPS